MSYGLIKFDYELGEQYLLYDDVIFTTNINVTRNYTTLQDVIDGLTETFTHDYWRYITVPLTTATPNFHRTVVTTLFKNPRIIVSQSTNIGGVNFYNNVQGSVSGSCWTYCDRQTGNGGLSVLQSSIFCTSSSQIIIGFTLYKSDFLDFSNNKTTTGNTCHYVDITITSGTYNIKTYSANVTYGNGAVYDFIPYSPIPVDPFSPGGTSEPGGGEGNFDDTSDPVPVSDLPTISVSDTNFITLYNPTLQQINDLASWMWSPLCVIEDLKKLWNNPMQAILGLSIVPVSPVIYDTPSQIYLGNLASPVIANKIATQYKRVPCGYVDIEEYWGSYLDYSPYTKAEIYLPYIGIRELNVDDIMGKQVNLVYNIDVASGACVAQLLCGDSVLYQFSGNCATSVPITGNDWTNVINGAISVAVSGAMLAVGTPTGATPVMASTTVGVAGSVAQNVMSMKPTILKSGSLSGSSGFLGVQKPYMIITRPRQAVPENQNIYTGYPSYVTANLSDLSGMTYVSEIHLESVPATESEVNEIERLLKEGVIL